MRSTKSPSWIERALGFEPLPAPPHVFSITARALRYGCFRPAVSSRFQPLELRATEVPEGTFRPEAVGASLASVPQLEGAVAALVGSVSGPVTEASLLVPDEWVRMTFVEPGELPRSPEARRDVVRWKLKRSLPVRPEDLRFEMDEIEPLPGQALERRVLVTYGLDRQLAGIEAAFQAAGVRIGRLWSQAMGALAAVRARLSDAELAAVVIARPGGYTLVLVRSGEPVLYRTKSADEGNGAGPSGTGVERDLRLTRAFVDRQLAGVTLERLLLFVTPELEARWSEWLEQDLGIAPEVVAAAELATGPSPEPLSWPDAASMIGAVSVEIE